MMTQQDYKVLAAALASVRPPNTFDVLYVHWAQTCIAVEGALERDNPRFKRDLFRDACLDGQVGLEREALGRLASGDSIVDSPLTFHQEGPVAISGGNPIEDSNA